MPTFSFLSRFGAAVPGSGGVAGKAKQRHLLQVLQACLQDGFFSFSWKTGMPESFFLSEESFQFEELVCDITIVLSSKTR